MALPSLQSMGVQDAPHLTSQTGFAKPSSGIGMASLAAPILQGIVGLATIQDYKAQTKATLDAIDLEVKSFKEQASIIGQQAEEIDKQLFNTMSQRGLEALKAEARLRAAAAETGTTGGTTDVAIGQAFMAEAMDAAVLTSRAKQQKINTLRRLDMANIGTRNKLASFKGGMASPTGAFIGAAKSSADAFRSAYSMLSDSARDELFNWS